MIRKVYRRDVRHAQIIRNAVVKNNFTYLCLPMFFLMFFLEGKTWAQATPKAKIIKQSTIKRSDGSFGYLELDKKGNAVFSFNNGLNGSITMIFASEYDSLNREVRSFSAHSNLGFSYSEYIYAEKKIYYYNYDVSEDSLVDCSRDELDLLNTREKFLQSPKIKLLKESNRTLSLIKELDENQKILKEIYIAENGDTSSMNVYEYDSLGREKVFRLGVIGDDQWRWNVYSEYDEQSNRVLTYRMEPTANGEEKSEVRSYTYDKGNHRIKEDYYNRGIFQNQSIYTYDKAGRRKESLFYEGEPDQLDHRTLYKYRGDTVVITIGYDYRSGEKERSKQVLEFY